MRADVDRHIPRRQELPQLIDGFLGDLFFRFVGMQPLRVFNAPVTGEIETFYFVAIGFGSRLQAQKIRQFLQLHFARLHAAIPRMYSTRKPEYSTHASAWSPSFRAPR